MICVKVSEIESTSLPYNIFCLRQKNHFLNLTLKGTKLAACSKYIELDKSLSRS